MIKSHRIVKLFTPNIFPYFNTTVLSSFTKKKKLFTKFAIFLNVVVFMSIEKEKNFKQNIYAPTSTIILEFFNTKNKFVFLTDET